MTLVIIVVIALSLFALAFMTKRRFGTLGLALAAGALLSDQLTRDLSMIIERNGVPVEPLSSTTAASVALILLPALILLLSGPVYKTKKATIIGAVAFALMGTMLILGPLTANLPLLDEGVDAVLNFIATYESLLIAVGIVGAVVDSWLTHSTKLGRKSKH